MLSSPPQYLTLSTLEIMKKVHYFVAFAMIFVVVYSCHTPSKKSENWIKQAKGRYKCDLTNQYSTEQRRNMYPFNKAETVLFIAFRNYPGSGRKITKTIADTTYTPEGKQVISDKHVEVYIYPCDEPNVIKQWLPIKGSLLVDVSKYCAIESIQLNQAQIDSLSNILLNHKVTIKGEVGIMIKGCYTPRNTIIFLDKSENPIGYIEICFECGNIYGSDKELNEITNIRLCSEKLSKIESLFKSVGIHYGIDVRY